MRHIKYVGILCIFLYLCVSCGKHIENIRLPLLTIGSNEIADLDPLKLADSTVKLSQIVDNVKVVALETVEEAMLSGISMLIGDEYILANRGNEIYQFASDGKFIRIIAKKGRGPEEIPSMGRNISYNINEELDLLYITCIDDIYLYRLSSGEFLGKKSMPGFGELKEARGVTITSSDSLFVYSYFSRGVENDALCSGVAVQAWNGDIIWRKEFDYLTRTELPSPINEKFLTGSNISVVNTDNPREFIFQVDNHDTCYLFNVDDLSIEPYLLRRTQGPLNDGYPIGRYCQGSYFLYQEFNRVNGLHLMRMNLTAKFVNLSNMEIVVYNVLYDDNTKTAYNINKFENEYLGFTHRYFGPVDSQSYIYPLLAPPYGKFLIIYEAPDFVKLANEELKNPDISKEVKERLLTLLESVSETDNPLLLIGDVKNKFTTN